MLVWDLEICKDISLLRKADQIILYGSAVKGREILAWLRDAGIPVNNFCDMDRRQWEKQVDDLEVLSPFQLKSRLQPQKQVVYFIACIQYPKELLLLLRHMELDNIRILTYWGIKTALQINGKVIYKNNTKRVVQLCIDNSIRKNKFVDIGLLFMQELIKAPDNAIWIIQPGKTASSSLEARFKEKNVPFIKEHFLEYPSHIIGEDYRNVWEKSVLQSRKSLKVIIAVREPLSRDYSTFWQAFTEGLERISLMPVLHTDFQQMYNSFLDLILRGSIYTKERLGISMPWTWNDEFEWFDEQIKQYLDIDVFQYPFNKEKGYVLIEKENIQLFLFKVEKMEYILDEISKFAGVSDLPVKNANVAEQKWYGLAYEQFRREVRLPKNYVDHYYNENAKVDYFYTQEEKENFLEKWRGNIDD